MRGKGEYRAADIYTIITQVLRHSFTISWSTKSIRPKQQIANSERLGGCAAHKEHHCSEIHIKLITFV